MTPVLQEFLLTRTRSGLLHVEHQLGPNHILFAQASWSDYFDDSEIDQLELNLGSGPPLGSVALERDAYTALTGSPFTLAGASSQTKRLVFWATAGQTIGIGTTNLVVTPNPVVNFKLVDPDGGTSGFLFSCNGTQSLVFLFIV